MVIVIAGVVCSGLMMGERPAHGRTAGMLKGPYMCVGDADERMIDAELYEIDVFKKGISDDVFVHSDASCDILDADSAARYILDV